MDDLSSVREKGKMEKASSDWQDVPFFSLDRTPNHLQFTEKNGEEICRRGNKGLCLDKGSAKYSQWAKSCPIWFFFSLKKKPY